MVPNATKLCYKSVFLHFSSILSQLLLKIVHYFGFRHAHKPKFELFGFFFFFADSFLIFSRFFCFPFSLPFFSLYLLPFIAFLSTGKVLASVLLKPWKWNIDQLGDLAYFTTNFAAKIGHVFLVKLCQDLVDIQNGHTYGWICPCCASCLSKQSGDVKNDDVTSG